MHNLDICPRCKAHMNTGDIVVMDWSGRALSHVDCVEIGGLDDTEEMQLLEAAIVLERQA